MWIDGPSSCSDAALHWMLVRELIGTGRARATFVIRKATESSSFTIRRSAIRFDQTSDFESRRSSAGAYIFSAYSLTMRRAEKRGATERIASFTIASQRRGTPA